MKFIQPKPYQWIVPSLVLVSGIIGLTNSNLGKTIQVIWCILIAFSIVFLIIGIANHRKYCHDQHGNATGHRF